MQDFINWVRDQCASLGSYVLLIVRTTYIIFTQPPQGDLLTYQMYAIGVQSLPVVAITGFSTGMVLAAQAFFQLSDKGLASATGLMVTKAMMVELGPVLTAFMVTGRVGAAMCAELGTMKVTEQIDAISSMSVDPLRYLIAPRLLSGLLMLPLLTVFSCVMGIFGGYIVAVNFYHLPHSTFIDPLPVHITSFDFISGIAKSIVFGFIIITISCYKGLKTRGGALGVGESTTKSVVICYSIILITNFILTLILNSINKPINEFFERVF